MSGRRRITVVEVTRGLGLGGAERALMTRVAAADHDRFEYLVVNALPASSQLELPGGTRAARVLELPGTSELRRQVHLLRLLRRVQPDVVNVHAPSVAAVLKAARPLIGARVLIETVHGTSYRSRLVRQAAVATRDHADACIAVGDAVRGTPYVPTSDHRVHTLRLGVDLPRIAASREAARTELRGRLELDARTTVVAMVASFRPEKDHAFLVEAATRHADELRAHRMVFALAGDGPTFAAASTAVERAGIADLVRLLGPVGDGSRVAAAADLVMLCSRHEGLPVCFMEALAAGVPVLSSDVGGVREILLDHVNGLLFPRGDHAAFRAQLTRLVADDELRTRLGAGASDTGRRWSAAASARSHESLYAQLVQTKVAA